MKANAFMPARCVGLRSVAFIHSTPATLVAGRQTLTRTTRNTEAASTKVLRDHHVTCWGERDLERILSENSPDILCFAPNGSRPAAEAMRPWFQAMRATCDAPGAASNQRERFSEADPAHMLWTAETPDNESTGYQGIPSSAPSRGSPRAAPTQPALSINPGQPLPAEQGCVSPYMRRFEGQEEAFLPTTCWRASA